MIPLLGQIFSWAKDERLLGVLLLPRVLPVAFGTAGSGLGWRQSTYALPDAGGCPSTPTSLAGRSR